MYSMRVHRKSVNSTKMSANPFILTANIFSRLKVLGIGLICIAGGDFCCHRVICKCNWTLQALWPALPAPTVPRRRSYSSGMGEEDREGGAILGVAFFRLLCSFNERAQLPKDTSTSPAQLLPSSRSALQRRAKLAFLSWRVISSAVMLPGEPLDLGGCRSTEL